MDYESEEDTDEDMKEVVHLLNTIEQNELA